ncbi:MAG: AAA family ATPase [Planctomycetota bacterium]
MSRKKERAESTPKGEGTASPPTRERQRNPAEIEFGSELAALSVNDTGDRPLGWRLSPRAVREFICGREQPLELDGRSVEVKRKFFGDDALVERAIITLATDRGLMLIGEPGTAKSMLSELLAAAISGASHLTIQGSAATTEDQIKYTWNYALLLAKGPSREALVPGPLFQGMSGGRITRFEEITRCPLEVQDVIVPVLSERLLIVPELGDAGLLFARPGFNIIATANTRDRGVNEMSSALKRRFNFETVQPIPELADELELVHREVGHQLDQLGVGVRMERDVAELLVTTFHELRSGRTVEGAAIQQPGGVISTAEAVAVGLSASLHAKYYGDGKPGPEEIVRHLAGSLLKEADDRKALKAYFDVTVKARAANHESWKQFYRARRLI